MAEDQEIYVLDEASMVRLWLERKVETGAMTQPQATRFWNDYAGGGTKFLANYFSLGTDILLLGRLLKDLGTPFAKVTYKTYGGKAHIIFKGRPGLRKILSGTRYGVTNAKIVSLGIGKKGARHVARSGGIISIILVSAWNITDFVLRDEVTLGQFIGQLSTDIAKIAASTAIGAMAGTAAAAVIGGFALGPLFAAVAVGAVAGLVLNYLDDKYGWTKALQSYLDRKIAEMNAKLRQIRNDVELMAIRNVADLLDDVVDAAAESARRRAKREIDKYLPNLPSIPSLPSLPSLPRIPSLPTLPSWPRLPWP